jgi:hypothetical protein
MYWLIKREFIGDIIKCGRGEEFRQVITIELAKKLVILGVAVIVV